MRGVPGGGRISENCDARVKRGDFVGERVALGSDGRNFDVVGG